jgi:amidase
MWEDFFTSFDVLICPVVFTTAFDHNHEPDMFNRTIMVDGIKRHYSEITVWPSVATLPQLPSLVIPIGQNAKGLPIGVQVIGPYLEDYTPIAFAQAIEGICSGYNPPSIVQ